MSSPPNTADRPAPRAWRGALVTLALVGVVSWSAATWVLRSRNGGADALEPIPTSATTFEPVAIDRAERSGDRKGVAEQPQAAITESQTTTLPLTLESSFFNAEVVLLLPNGDPFPGLELRAHRASDGWRWVGRSDAAGRCSLPGARTADGAPVELRVTGDDAWPCVWTDPLEPVVVRHVPRRGELDVVVTDTSGSPIGNALVRMIPRSSSLRESRPAAVECDVNGWARLPTVVGADITLQATAPGFVGRCLQLERPYDGVSTAAHHLELARAAFHRVVVVDANGVPAAGLVVQSPSGTILDTTTDEEGAVAVPAESGPVMLFVEPPGDPYRAPLRLTLQRTLSRATTRVVLPEPVRLRLAFTGDGAPVTEALTIRERNGATSERFEGCIDPAEGELQLLMEVWQTTAPLLPGLVALDAPIPWSDVEAVELRRGGGSVRIAPSSFELRDGVPTTALPASVGVVGRVVQVATMPGDWALFVAGPRGYQKRCDIGIAQDGTFRAERLSAGPFTLSFIPTLHLATPPGVIAGVTVFRGDLKEGEVLDLGELHTPGLGDLVTIRVVEPGGAPAYGAVVTVEADAYRQWRGAVGDGGISLVALAPGIAYTVRAGRGGAWSSNLVTWQSSVSGGVVELLLERR